MAYSLYTFQTRCLPLFAELFHQERTLMIFILLTGFLMAVTIRAISHLKLQVLLFQPFSSLRKVGIYQRTFK